MFSCRRQLSYDMKFAGEIRQVGILYFTCIADLVSLPRLGFNHTVQLRHTSIHVFPLECYSVHHVAGQWDIVIRRH